MEGKLATMWRDEKAPQLGRSSDMETVRRDVESQKIDDAGVRRDRIVAKHFVCPVLCGSGGWKNRFPKAAGAETAGQLSNEKAHAGVARSKVHNQVS